MKDGGEAKVYVRKFHDTDIPAMTYFVEKNRDSLQEEVWDWIDGEIANAKPHFNSCIIESMRGMLMRACLIATHKNWMENQMLVIAHKDKENG